MKRICFPVLTPNDMRRTEQKFFDAGMPEILLMEHAALCVVNELEKMLGGDCSGKTVLFLCGTGNNGGDGYAAARLFLNRGGKALVISSGEPKTENAKANARLLSLLDACFLNRDQFDPRQQLDAVVDAIFGIGFHGVPQGEELELIGIAKACCAGGILVLSVDVPSGVNALTGETDGENYVRAHGTVTFHGVKPGLYFAEKREHMGRIVLADIGLPARLQPEDTEIDGTVLTPEALAGLKKRPLNAHKGDCGRVLIYAGSMGMAGAAAMCAKAAIAAGAGLTTIVCEKEIIPVLQVLVPNAMCVEIGDALMNPPAYDVLALGCGLGQSEETWRKILKLWNKEKPSVWDADALNLLAKHPMDLGEKAYITPHLGEAARLLNGKVETVKKDRLAAAEELCRKYSCTVLLKSDVTIACQITQSRPRYVFNVTGSPALAKGGSGDALTGILAALHDETASSAYNAALASLWHGMAGRAGEKKFGMREMTTDQMISCLYEAESPEKIK